MDTRTIFMRLTRNVGRRFEMKAIVLTKTCSAEELKVSEVPIPEVRSGWVLVKIRAFGINHSEILLRKFEADAPYIHLPRIPGIECAGEIENPSDSSFMKGDKVIALMGGMGRSFDGSYAEYALLPEKNVFSVDTEMSWEQLAAIPESFYTAYGSLVDCLPLDAGDSLMIRGATSTVGLAAIQLAKAIGAKVIATTRSTTKRTLLQSVGCDEVVIDNGTLFDQVHAIAPNGVNKILELVGPATLSESLHLAAFHGIVCSTGVLGNRYFLSNFDPIKEIPNGVYLTGFYSNFPTREAIDGMFGLIRLKHIVPVISKVFPFDQIAEAHLLAESGKANGKIVVTIN